MYDISTLRALYMLNDNRNTMNKQQNILLTKMIHQLFIGSLSLQCDRLKLFGWWVGRVRNEILSSSFVCNNVA